MLGDYPILCILESFLQIGMYFLLPHFLQIQGDNYNFYTLVRNDLEARSLSRM